MITIVLLNLLQLCTSLEQYTFVSQPLDCEPIGDYANSWDGTHDAKETNYYLSGQFSYHNSYYQDRRFKWKYCRPNSPNTNFSYTTHSYTLTPTNYNYPFNKACSESSNEIMTRAYSIHHNYYQDRSWTYTCTRLQPQFSLTDCTTTSYVNTWGGIIGGSSYAYFNWYSTSNNVVITGIYSYHSNYYQDRRWRFSSCKIEQQPMTITSVAPGSTTQRYFVGGLKSLHSTNVRSLASVYYTTPTWYLPETLNTQTSLYQLPKTNVRAVWTRICPTNGAIKDISLNDGIYEIECANLVSDLKVDSCEWTDNYVNNFGESYDFQCNKNGPMRGVQSYFSEESNDRRFKFYCCQISRDTYLKNNNIEISIRASNISIPTTNTTNMSNPTGPTIYTTVLLDLCWNAKSYQAIVIHKEYNAWFSTAEVVKYGICGNERSLTISNYDSIEPVAVNKIKVVDDGAEYVIDTFCVHNSSTTCANTKEILMVFDDVPAYTVHFPDNYMTVCSTVDGGNGCVGETFDIDDAQQYLMTIIPCSSFNVTGIRTPKMGVVISGLNGNFDKKILIGPEFENQLVGIGDIGDILSINLELESGDDYCVQSIELNDPFSGEILTFGQDIFADGIFLSKSCLSNYWQMRDFKQLSGIHYVPCIDTQFMITTVQHSLYTSIQIHSCNGENAGTHSSFSISMTVTGVTANNKITSTQSLSLVSNTRWDAGESRDFTFPISGIFKEVTLIALTNHNSDAFCVDNILINGQNAFLTHYWVGLSSDMLPTIPAVLKWPICNVELTTTIKSKTELKSDPEMVATSSCINRNRLLSTTCSIEQTFETYEQMLWQHQTTLQSLSIESDAQTTTSITTSTSTSLLSGSTITSFDSGASRSFSASVGFENSITTLDVVTDGKVNGETIPINCNGQVTVGPSQEVGYEMLISNTASELTTLTDIKMTKCAAYTYETVNNGQTNPNDYIYIYGIEGKLTVKDATNCYISYSQATPVNPTSIECNEERQLAARDWDKSTYVPMCNENDPTLYNSCQCSFGNLEARPTCACVDESTGDLLPETPASIVETSDSYTWKHWCNNNCNSSYLIDND